MLEIGIIAGVIVVVCVVVWIVLRPKTTQKGSTAMSSKTDRSGEKRVSNVSSNKDAKIEGIGESIIKIDVQNAIYWKIYQNHLFVVRETNGLVTCSIYNQELGQVGSWQYIGDMWCIVYSKIKSWFAPFYVTGWSKDYTTGVVRNMPHRVATATPTIITKIKEKQLLYNLDEIFEEEFAGL